MNKIFKVVWSKAKNCYVVASELAKRRTKLPKSCMFSRTLVAGILSCVLQFGAVMHAFAATTIIKNGNDTAFFQSDSDTLYVYTDANGYATKIIAYTDDGDDGPNWDYTILLTNYTAGKGITISGNTISAKAGSGITVNADGISLTAGSIASGNANAITGGTAYSELRPSANGNYVKHKNSI